MWHRVSEVILGLWLLLSPMLFTPPANSSNTVEWLSGAAVIVLAVASFWRPLRRAHLLELGPAVWLGVSGLFGADWAAGQNRIITALLLFMLLILPSNVNLPPDSWRARSAAERGQ